MAVVDFIPASWRLAMARSLTRGAGLPIVPEWLRASFFEPSWRNLVKEGWKANAAVYGCIAALAMTFPEPRMKVLGVDGKLLEKHPLQKLLRRPNSMMSESEFKAYCITWWALGGNLYLHKVRNQAGRVIALWPYHAGHIMPVPGTLEWVDRYEYDSGSGRTQSIPREDIIHVKWPLPDPEQPWMATPPLLHVAREVDTDNEATKYLFALLKNDALPRTVIEVPEGREPLTAEQFRRLKTQFNERYGGSRRGSVGLLEGGAKMSRVALNMQELAFEALRRVPEARIAAAFRVPPIVAGLNVGLEEGTYSNYEQAVQQMTKSTLVPLWELFGSELTQGLGEEFGDEVEVHPDLSQVRALQENETEKWKRIDMAVRGGWMTPNEGRTRVGLDPLAGGDELRRPTGPFGEGGAVPDAGKSTAEDVAERLMREWSRSQTVIVMPDGNDSAKSNGNGNRAEQHLQVLPPFGLKHIANKAARLEAERRIGETLQALRSTKAQLMEAELDKFFRQLAERVVSRAMTWGKAEPALAVPAGAAVETKQELPPISVLLEPRDDDDLEALVRRFYADLLHVSWGVWDYALGTVVLFDVNDPAVSALLRQAAKRVRDIGDTTRDEIRDLLQYGSDHGWSIEQLVRGDLEADPPRPGLKDLVAETYKGRAKTIARTELGTAQQKAAADRYERAGVTHVLVLDNGFDNSDPVCIELGNGGQGTVKTLAWAKENPLQHPRCVRCFAPHFDGDDG